MKKETKLDPSRFRPEDEDYISDSKSAFLGKPTALASSILYLVMALLIIGLIWAYFAEIDQITVGEGKVIPITENKIIQSLDGGIITKILVKDGDIVQPNQVLIILDATRYTSDYRASYEKYLALSANVARLAAEASGQDQVVFPDFVVKESPELVARETQQFNIRRDALNKELDTLQEHLDSANQELAMYPPLLKKGYASKVEYLRAQNQVFEVKERILEKKNQFHNLVWTELNQHKAELASLTEQLNSLRDKMLRTTLRSPVYGMVKKVNVTTVGGVVSPGMTIMEIVPLADTLLIQVRVKPSEIAFVHAGEPATVKITAYDYAIFGSLDGVVEYVSPDVIEEPKPVTAQDRALPNYYLVNIRTNKNYFGTEKHKLLIIPGMGAMAYIKTGKKTVMTYLLKPLFKAKQEALRER